MISFEIPLVLTLLIPLAAIGLYTWEKTQKKVLTVLNVLTAALLVLAISGPELSFTEEQTETKTVHVLEDRSESSQLIEDFDLQVENVDFRHSTFNSDSEAFESQVKSMVEGDGTYLFSSDLQFETDLPSYFMEENASVSVLEAPIKEDHAVRIEGPSETVIGAENRFEVKVSSTAQPPEASLYLNDSVIVSGEPPLEEELSFDQEGFYNLRAKIDSEGHYDENSEYFKTVRVQEKPEIASIGQASTLEEDLEDFYDISHYSSIPEDLEGYESVLMKQPEDSPELRSYLSDGGGLVYTGSDYSPGYLPVDEADREEATDAPLVIILIDISSTMACQAGWCGDQLSESPDEENLARSVMVADEVVRGLPDNSRVSVLPYGYMYYDGEMAEPRTLALYREEVLDDISRIQPQNAIIQERREEGRPDFPDHAYHDRGLIGASSIADDHDGEANILMITDGLESTTWAGKRDAETEASTMDSRLITVGVPYDEEEGGLNRDFLEELADRNEEGFYVEADDSEQLELTFEAGGGDGEIEPVVVSDSDHFITDGFSPDATIHDVDGAEPEAFSSEILSTSSGDSVLTTSRYGLGRIAAFTADSEDLDSLMDDDPELVGRTFSWASGPLEADQWVEGSRVTDEITYVSREPDPDLTRESEERFTADLDPDETGIHQANSVKYEVNYRPEIERVGYDQSSYASFTHRGQVYSLENIDDISEEVDPQTVERETATDLRPIMLAFALLTYLGFVGVRKRNGLA